MYAGITHITHNSSYNAPATVVSPAFRQLVDYFRRDYPKRLKTKIDKVYISEASHLAQ